MKSIDSKQGIAVIAVSLLTLYLSLPFLTPYWNTASAAESEEERTAKLVEGAKREGKLLWYFSIASEEGDRIVKKFQEKYPFIQVALYRGETEGLLVRIQTEARAGRHLFDVSLIGGTDSEVLKRKGLFVKYLSPQSKFVRDGYKDPEGYWVSHDLVNNVVGYNTKLVLPRDVPKTYEDLLDPKWKGKMGMDTKAYYWFGSVLKLMGEAKGLVYMKKLSEQNIKFRTGRTLNAQLVAAGETSLGIALYTQRIEEMKEAGAPIEWVAIEPVILGFNHLGISANASHPNAARLFFDFAMSREGQELVASLHRIPTRSDVDPTNPRERGLKTLPFDTGIVDNYERYAKLYREVLMKK